MEYLDTYDTCQLLHVSRNTLLRLRQRGVLKGYHFDGSRKIFYKKDEIFAHLQEKKPPP